MGRKHDLEYQKIYKGKIGKIIFFPPLHFCAHVLPPKKRYTNSTHFGAEERGKNGF